MKHLFSWLYPRPQEKASTLDSKPTIQSLIRNPEFEQSINRLPAGIQTPAHSAPHEMTFFCLRGRGILLLNDKIVQLEMGTFQYLPANTTHALSVQEDLVLLSTRILDQPVCLSSD